MQCMYLIVLGKLFAGSYGQFNGLCLHFIAHVRVLRESQNERVSELHKFTFGITIHRSHLYQGIDVNHLLITLVLWLVLIAHFCRLINTSRKSKALKCVIDKSLSNNK